MQDANKLDDKLKTLFSNSLLIQKKLPSKEKQSILLAKLLKQPNSEKQKFINILEKFEEDLEFQANEQVKKLIQIKYKMKKIKSEADFIVKRIEMKTDQNDENDILNKLNE